MNSFEGSYRGDNSRLDREAVLTAAAIADELTFDTPWQRGDVALVDNFVSMHGRRTYQGVRKVLASLAEAQRAEPFGGGRGSRRGGGSP